MALYELVLRAGGKERIYVTDHPVHVGQRLRIDAKVWEVVSEEPPTDPEVDFRFILHLANGGFANRFTKPSV